MVPLAVSVSSDCELLPVGRSLTAATALELSSSIQRQSLSLFLNAQSRMADPNEPLDLCDPLVVVGVLVFASRRLCVLVASSQ